MEHVQKRASRKTTVLLAGLLFALTLALCVCQIYHTHDWGDDFAQYIAQAKALVDGTVAEFVEANRFIVYHSPVEMATAVYPWGYSLLLAPVYALFGESLTAFKLVQCVLIAAAAAAFYLLLSRRFCQGLALTAGVCFGVDQALLIYANYIMSDQFYLLLTILCFDLLLRAGEAGERAWIGTTLFGLCAALAYLCRAQGICLMLALLGCQAASLLRRRFAGFLPGFALPLAQSSWRGTRAVVAQLAPYAVFAAVVAAVNLTLPRADRSSFYFLESLTLPVLGANIASYATLLKDLLPYPARMAGLAYGCCCAFAAAGLIWRREKDAFMLLYALGIAGTCLLFPWSQGARYLLSVFPVLIVYTLYGVALLLERVRAPRALLVAAAIALCMTTGYRAVKKSAQNIALKGVFDAGAYSCDAMDTYDYIRTRTPEDAVIAFFKPRLLWLETGRLSYRADGDAQRLNLADYLLTTTDGDYLDMDALRASVEAYNASGNRLTLATEYENDRFTLYRIVSARAARAPE